MAQPKEKRLVTEAAASDVDIRTGLGIASLTRGHLTAVNLDDLHDAEHVGTYTARAQDIVGGPNDLGSGQRMTHVIVTRAVSNGIMQQVVNEDGMWYRILQNQVGWVWYPWKKISDAAPPILASDADTQFGDGQTLWVYDDRVAATDFDLGAVGWTRLMGTGVWDMVDVPEFPSGKGVVFLRNSGYSGDSMLSWDLYGDSFLDGEAVMTAVIRAETSARSHCVAVRASYTGDAFTGYIAGVTWESGQAFVFIGKIIDGAYSRMSRTAIDTVQAGVPYKVRFRIEGNWLRATAWTVTDSEPVEWQVAAAAYPVSTALSAGRVGVLHSGTGGRYVGGFSVDASGGTA